MINTMTVPSVSALMGNMSSVQSLDNINNSINNFQVSNFSKELQSRRDSMINHVINPLRKTYDLIKGTFNIGDSNLFKSITTLKDLNNPPPIMYEAILTHKPIYKLWVNERIDGYDVVSLPDRDIYGDYINTGTVEDVLDNMDDDGCIEHVITWTDEDPDLSFKEMDMILDTREYLDELLATTMLDPTNIYKRRG